MSQSVTGGELFIVDNSDEEWKGLKYLGEWTEIAKAFDIATGFFEIGSMLALDGKWQRLDKIRILLGDQMSARTRQALLEGLRERTKAVLDASIEGEKEKNDFLQGIPAIVEGIRSKKIECRVYAKRKFHAKAYITHPKVSVIGSVALVGSSNFTIPGLTQNIELNIQVRAAGDVESLQKWFEKHWQEGEDVSEDILRVIQRQIAEYTPFQVYAKALHEMFQSRELSSGSWELTKSKMYPVLDHYQREAYNYLLNIAKQHRGALLCDGVGLGKTYVGLLLIERLIMHDRKRVALLVPKSGRVAVWERSLKKFLPHLLGDFSNLVVYNHTDLMRGGDYPDKMQHIKELADVIVIDEAHHFRNRGLATSEDGEILSRYWKLYDILQGKSVFMLTATPVNNHLTDFQHLVELFSGVDSPAAFATTLGIQNMPAHFSNLEKQLKKIVANAAQGEPSDYNQAEAERVLFDDKLFRELVVQRSRAYVGASQRQHGVREALFPIKETPRVAKYSVKKTYGRLLTMLEKAFAKKKPLFSLPMYYPLAYWKGDVSKLDKFDVNRQDQLVRLIRILFLKRFESSIVAFESSCQNLLLKMLAFLQKNVDRESPAEVKRLEKWKSQNEDALEHIRNRQKQIHEKEDAEENDLAEWYSEDVEMLDRDEYKVDEIINETYSDLEEMVGFIEELQRQGTSHDDKVNTLVSMLKKDDVLSKHKVVIFTEFMSTARYLKQALTKAGIKGVEEIDSEREGERSDVIQEFAPYYNDSSSAQLQCDGRKEIRVLVSTDVLSEGLNLQDATRLINYDIHWNPVRLMQRIGRVDRRLDQKVEEKIIADHPDQAQLRGKVVYWNFLPPEEVEGLLGLYNRVSYKTLRISKVFGIEGKKLLTPQDDYDALKDFIHQYEGEESPMEVLDLEYNKLVQDNPGLQQFLDSVPLRLFSGKRHPSADAKAVFFCYRLPAEDKTQTPEKSWHAGTSRPGWYLYDIKSGKITEDPPSITQTTRSSPDTLRATAMEQATLREIRLKVEKHIKNTYLKQVDAPLGADPILKCWMELC